MEDPKVLERIRADWNQRGGEDAYYYVAFGRRERGQLATTLSQVADDATS